VLAAILIILDEQPAFYIVQEGQVRGS